MADSESHGGVVVLQSSRTIQNSITESEYSSTYNSVRNANFYGRSKNLSPFQLKFLTIACILIVIPLISSKPPRFIGDTIFSKVWDFLRFSIIGVVISYGLCHQSDDYVDFGTQSSSGTPNVTNSRYSSGFRYNNVYSSSEKNRYGNEEDTDRGELDLVANNLTLEISDLDASSSIDYTDRISRSEISHIPFIEGDGNPKKLSTSGNDIPFILSGDVNPKKSSNPIQTSLESNVSNEDEQPIRLSSQHYISSIITMDENQKKSNSELKNKEGVFLQKDQKFHRGNTDMMEENGLKLFKTEPKISPWSYFESDLMQPQFSPLISSAEEMETIIYEKYEETDVQTTPISSSRPINNLDIKPGRKAHYDLKPAIDRDKQSKMLRLLKETDQLSTQIEELNVKNNDSYSSEVSKFQRPKIDEKKLPFSITVSETSSHSVDCGIGKSSTVNSFLNSDESESTTKTKELSSLKIPSDHIEEQSEIQGSCFISDEPLVPGSRTMNTEDIITPKYNIHNSCSSFPNSSKNISLVNTNPSAENEKEEYLGGDQRVLEPKASEEIQVKSFSKPSLKGKSVRTFRSKCEGGRKSADVDEVQRDMYENKRGKTEFEMSGNSKMKINNSEDGGRRLCHENSIFTEMKTENMHAGKGHGNDEFVVAEPDLGGSTLGVNNTNNMSQNRIEGKAIKSENSIVEKEMRSKPEKRSGIHRLWNGFRKQSVDNSTTGMVKIRDMIRDQTEKDMNGNFGTNYEGELQTRSGVRRQNKDNSVLGPKLASQLHISEQKEEFFKNKFTSYGDEDGDFSETDVNNRSRTTNEIDKRASDFISRFRKQMQVEKVPVIANEIDLKAGEFISKFKERIKHEKSSVKFR